METKTDMKPWEHPDFDDSPPLDDDFWKRAKPSTNPDLVRKRGSQKAPTKVATSVRLDADVLEHFKAAGKGWQGRMNEALRRAAGLPL
jgi:uncharacterized protein (DUF4415 family)